MRNKYYTYVWYFKDNVVLKCEVRYEHNVIEDHEIFHEIVYGDPITKKPLPEYATELQKEFLEKFGE